MTESLYQKVYIFILYPMFEKVFEVSKVFIKLDVALDLRYYKISHAKSCDWLSESEYSYDVSNSCLCNKAGILGKFGRDLKLTLNLF